MREKKPIESLSLSHSQTLTPGDTSGLNALIDAALISLTVARWLLPTEATAEGETLWIAGLWFLVGGLLGIWCWRTGRRRRGDAADLAAGLFIGGPVVSGLTVICTEGDQRAAINLLWEWLSLGVLWFAWRARLDSAPMRRRLTLALLATAVTLSLWGLWQHFVWYPQMRAEYGPVFDQLQHTDSAAARKKLGDAGIPTDGPARELFKNRLLNSQEPFGPFGLANTLGGLLAAWLVVGICTTIASRRAGGEIPPMPSAGYGVALWMPVAACLYLTNSRTAWGGFVAALGAGGVLLVSRRCTSETVRRMLFPAAALTACVAAWATLAWIMTGEHEVPGPLKSLAYRAEYWIGAWRLLRTVPWLGVGPGQFRDRYLPFRLPESSEEIADPHNILLDAWANGGLIGLAGLLGLLGVLLYRLGMLQSPSPATAGTFRRSIAHGPFLGLSAFPLVILGQLVSTGVWDDHADLLVIFAVLWGVSAWLLSRCFQLEGGEWAWAGPLAALALSVHLLGAGGIAMPATTELWLLLIALGLPRGEVSAENSSTGLSRRLPLLGSLACLVLLAGWFVTGWRPTTQAKRWLAEGDYQFSTTGDGERAERFFRQAASADPWSAEPWQRLAEVEFSRAISPGGAWDPSRLDAARQHQQAAMRRSPFRFPYFLREAEMLAAAARHSRQRTDWSACLVAYEAAERRHPTHVRLLADHALALADAGHTEAAAEMARKALQQDELNHRRGHTDRYLSEGIVGRLHDLSVETANSPEIDGT